MGKIALLTDTHWGNRNDDPRFIDNSKLFLDNVFFPTLEKECIKTVVHLGDVVERRQFLNTHTAYRMRVDFIDRIKEYDFHWILGNHDVFYKDTNSVNAAREYYPYLQYYEKTTEVLLEGRKVLFVPWLCPDNTEHAHELIRKTKSQIVMGHLDLQNFEMHHKGSETNAHGDNPERYYRFLDVLSGHFHHKSSRDNIHYLGAFSELNWHDYDDARGFHLYDLDTRELTHVINPYHMYNRIHYFEGMDVPDVKDKYLRIFIKAGYQPNEVDKFLSQIHDGKPIAIEVSYETDDYTSDNLTDNMDGKTALDLLIAEIEHTELPINKDKTKAFASEIYKRAHEIILQ